MNSALTLTLSLKETKNLNNTGFTGYYLNLSERKFNLKKDISRSIRLSFIIAVKVVERIASSSHDSVELVEVEHSVAVSVGLFQHFFKLLIGNFLTNFAGNSFQVLEGDFV